MAEIEVLQKYLLFFRKMLGWNAQKLGEAVGVTRQTINNIESGKNKLSQTLYLALIFIFKEEISKSYSETKMFGCVLDILVLHPEYYLQSQQEQALHSATLLVPAISASGVSRKDVSEEWVRNNKIIYQRYFERLIADHQKTAYELEQISSTGQVLTANTNKKENDDMVITKKIDLKDYLEEYDSEIKDAILEHLKSNILEPVRHELWMTIDTNGKMSLKHNIGYATQVFSTDQRFLIYACGGENLTAWQLLPRIRTLLGEDFNFILESVSKATGKEPDRVTVTDTQEYIKEKHPEWIEEWLEEYYYSDPYGHLDNYVENYYEKLFDRFDGWGD